MPQHTAGAARPTPVAVVNGVDEKADLSLPCPSGHGREPAAAPRLPTPRERAVARWNALVHPHPQVMDEERENRVRTTGRSDREGPLSNYQYTFFVQR